MSRRLAALVPLVFLACATPKKERHGPVARVGLPGLTAKDPARLRVHVIDVGQGSAALLEFPCAAVLVDTGGEQSDTFDSTRSLLAYLDEFFTRRYDLNKTLAAVFISHPHIDHTRGLPEVMKRYTVQRLVTNGLPRGPDGLVLDSGGEQQENAEKEMRAKSALRTVSRGEIEPGGVTDALIDPVSCGDVDPHLSVLWGGMTTNVEGWDPKTFANANNHSLVLRVEVDGHVVLITGDLETEALHSLLAAQGETLNSDVLFVGHHGSHNGTTMALVQTATPCMAVISMGPVSHQEDWTAWAYGHPRKKAVDLVAHGLGCSRVEKTVPVGLGMRRFEDYTLHTALYGTGWEGTVVLEQSERGTWKASTER